MAEDLLKEFGAILLDGGMGTTLCDDGFDVASITWSAVALMTPEGREGIEGVHLRFFRAGSHVAITNSYKISPELLLRADVEGCHTVATATKKADELNRISVKLAQNARDKWVAESGITWKPIIAGSLGPYGTSVPYSGGEYKGNYGLTKEELKEFHRCRITSLMDAGSDLLGVETIPDLDEAQAIAELLVESFPDVKGWMCFTCPDTERVHSGQLFLDCVRVAHDCPNILYVGVNCTNPTLVTGLLQAARTVTQKPLVVYPNSGEKWVSAKGERRWEGEVHSFGESLEEWYRLGAVLLGGCCRVDPEQIAGMAAAVKALGTKKE